ncbi:hypothetical protein FMN50_24100 [Rhodobacterales bacterium]|nr:hypothetical protein FMN50_24100 [Rhodobacterales bacterium]
MGFQFPNPFRRRTEVYRATSREVIDLIRRTTEYQALERATDQESADITVMSVLNFIIQSDPQLRNFASINRSHDFLTNIIPGFLTIELQKVQTSILHLEQLLFSAFANMAHELRTNPGLQRQPNQYGAAPNDSDSLKAAKWICSASGTVGRNPGQQTLSKIQDTIEKVLRLDMDLRDPRTLEYIHEAIVEPVALPSQAFRKPNRDTNYPGSGGGNYLRYFASQQAMQIQEFMAMPPTDPLPDPAAVRPGQIGNFNPVPDLARRFNNYGNIACYLFGAHIRAHSFSDGNGRTVRTLYACAMIKCGHGFIAPAPVFERRLTGL